MFCVWVENPTGMFPVGSFPLIANLLYKMGHYFMDIVLSIGSDNGEFTKYSSFDRWLPPTTYSNDLEDFFFEITSPFMHAQLWTIVASKKNILWILTRDVVGRPYIQIN